MSERESDAIPEPDEKPEKYESIGDMMDGRNREDDGYDFDEQPGIEALVSVVDETQHGVSSFCLRAPFSSNF